jgi:hypothetical protein
MGRAIGAAGRTSLRLALHTWSTDTGPAARESPGAGTCPQWPISGRIGPGPCASTLAQHPCTSAVGPGRVARGPSHGVKPAMARPWPPCDSRPHPSRGPCRAPRGPRSAAGWRDSLVQPLPASHASPRPTAPHPRLRTGPAPGPGRAQQIRKRRAGPDLPRLGVSRVQGLQAPLDEAPRLPLLPRPPHAALPEAGSESGLKGSGEGCASESRWGLSRSTRAGDERARVGRGESRR